MSVESRDYPDVHDVEDRSRGRRQKEFDALLDLAETVQALCDRVGQRVSFYRMSEVAMVLLGLIGAVPFAVGMSLSSTGTLTCLVTGIAVGGLFAAYVEYLVREFVVQRNRNRRALSEIVELLRSTERSIAKDESFSALERARLRIQLSRFDI